MGSSIEEVKLIVKQYPALTDLYLDAASDAVTQAIIEDGLLDGLTELQSLILVEPFRTTTLTHSSGPRATWQPPRSLTSLQLRTWDRPIPRIVSSVLKSLHLRNHNVLKSIHLRESNALDLLPTLLSDCPRLRQLYYSSSASPLPTTTPRDAKDTKGIKYLTTTTTESSCSSRSLSHSFPVVGVRLSDVTVSLYLSEGSIASISGECNRLLVTFLLALTEHLDHCLRLLRIRVYRVADSVLPTTVSSSRPSPSVERQRPVLEMKVLERLSICYEDVHLPLTTKGKEDLYKTVVLDLDLLLATRNMTFPVSCAVFLSLSLSYDDD